MSTCIEIKNLSKIFKTKENFQVDALKDINFSVEENEFISIVGPSGCGKSTLLRIIASLETSTDGTVIYRGEELNLPSSDIGMVFQNYSLLQWKTVIDNIALGLEFKKVKKNERREKAKEYLKLINMEGFAKAYPYELSGGMQQRVAIARALVTNPDVLLMDEPFGALDAHTRIILQGELLNIWQKNKKTILFVTHSVDEAIYLSDKIIVMGKNPGIIKEIINVDMIRPRVRSNPEYGKLTDKILNMLEH
ncbi:MAG: ABC transporter ATP-binding protein [Clostridium sp.]|uniref:ABC transporter ATP-binding protein n=1 Tax=Clostridium sp. TaxID=1506 RepID=UPI003023AFF7